jgi:hypothetical protein
VNLLSGKIYHGENLLYLKEHTRQNGFPTPEYITKDAMTWAGVLSKDGEKPVSISWSEKGEDGQWASKSVELFNIHQSENPGKVREYAQKEQQKQEENARAYFGDKYKPPAEKVKGPDVTCTSSKPAEYIGQYLAAVSMGSAFKATEKQSSEFRQNYDAAVFKRGENGKTNPFALGKLCNEASEVCKSVVKEKRQEQQNAQKQEQTQSRGSRGMSM